MDHIQDLLPNFLRAQIEIENKAKIKWKLKKNELLFLNSNKKNKYKQTFQKIYSRIWRKKLKNYTGYYFYICSFFIVV